MNIHDEWLIGHRLNERYLLTDVIGKGGMGIVYQATDEHEQKICAVKLLRTSKENERLRRRFEEEIRCISKLKSPHVIEVYDAGYTPEQKQFVVMELLEGLPLSEIVSTETVLGVERCLYITHGVLSALMVAHEQGIIHRDLKPENIFSVPKEKGETIKLLDFGIAKDLQRGTVLDLTRVGTLVGTPKYMPPESFEPQHVPTPQTDLYAVGILMYWMISGKVPFYPKHQAIPKQFSKLPHPAQVCWLHKFYTPNPLEIPSEINELVFSLIQKDPQLRPKSAQECLYQVESLIDEYSASSTHKLESPTEILPFQLITDVLNSQRQETLAQQKQQALNEIHNLSQPMSPFHPSNSTLSKSYLARSSDGILKPLSTHGPGKPVLQSEAKTTPLWTSLSAPTPASTVSHGQLSKEDRLNSSIPSSISSTSSSPHLSSLDQSPYTYQDSIQTRKLPSEHQPSTQEESHSDESRTISVDPQDLKKVHEALRQMSEEQIPVLVPGSPSSSSHSTPPSTSHVSSASPLSKAQLNYHNRATLAIEAIQDSYHELPQESTNPLQGKQRGHQETQEFQLKKSSKWKESGSNLLILIIGIGVGVLIATFVTKWFAN